MEERKLRGQKSFKNAHIAIFMLKFIIVKFLYNFNTFEIIWGLGGKWGGGGVGVQENAHCGAATYCVLEVSVVLYLKVVLFG